MLSLLLLAVLPMALSAPQYDREVCSSSVQLEKGVLIPGEESAVECGNRCKELTDCHVYYSYYEVAKGTRTCYLYESGDIVSKEDPSGANPERFVLIHYGTCQ